ncbi:MAG: iron-containing alcohol dehydrogenase [bacterium]
MDIYKVLGKSFRCKYCGRTHLIPTKKVLMEENALIKLPRFIGSLIPKANTILLLADEITFQVAGETCTQLLKDKYRVVSTILTPRKYPTVHAESIYFSSIRRKAQDCDIILTIGTGSITDMGKYIGTELKIPVIAVPTAPSMNAYTSAVSAYIEKGIKITAPITPALGVIADTNIIANSPMELIQAGFADSQAKSFANADWQISAVLSGETFCSLPLILFSSVEKQYKAHGDRLIKRDKKTILALMEGLNLGGFSMVIAGKSAPASGGEHLISHFLDMVAHKKELDVFSYHGLQVGVGVVTSARLFERLREIKSPLIKKIDYDAELKKLFGKDTGKFRDKFSKKLPYLKKIAERWDEIIPILSQPPASKDIIKYLKKAQCPTTFAEIGVNKTLAKQTVLSARYIRDRITVLDLATELGVLQDVLE